MARMGTAASLGGDHSELREGWRQIALKIALNIKSRARRARNGDLYWTQPTLPERSKYPQLDSYLYPGSLGVSLFFALGRKVLGEEEFAGIARGGIAPFLRDLREIALDPVRIRNVRRPIGGLAGLGSIIYGLVRLGDLLNDPQLWDDAQVVSRFISPSRIREDQALEVMTGSAGALLALLALDDRLPQSNADEYTPLELATIAGDHLLKQKGRWLDSNRDGAAFEHADLSSIGFCHGVAGIATALARLDQRLGGDRFSSIVEEAWAAVDRRFDHLAGFWKLPKGNAVMSTTWCNGATGLLFARALCFGVERCRDDEIFRRAVEVWLASGLADSDHLCCGNLGRVDTLVHLSSSFGGSYLEEAGRIAQRVLDRASNEERFHLMFYPHGADDVRLFPGLSGVGYSFLRLVEPQSLPSVLALV